jgi:hypothetical protein
MPLLAYLHEFKYFFNAWTWNIRSLIFLIYVYDPYILVGKYRRFEEFFCLNLLLNNPENTL